MSEAIVNGVKVEEQNAANLAAPVNPTVPPSPDNHEQTATATVAPTQPPADADDGADDDVTIPESSPDKAGDRLVAQAVKAFARGVGTQTLAWLEAGRHCHAYYLHRVLKLGHKREAATRTLEGELLRYADDSASADASRLAQVFNAVQVLTDGAGIPAGKDAPRIAWGKLIAVAPLVERDAATEGYSLKSEVDAEKAKMLFLDVVNTSGTRDAVPLATVKDRVKVLLGKKPTQPSTPPAPTVQTQPSTGASPTQPTAGAPTVATIAPVSGTEQMLPTTQPPAAPFVSTLPPGAVVNPPKPEKPAPTVEEKTDDPEETALSICELVEDSAQPDDVIEKVCELLATSKKVSNPTKRALQAALMLMKRKASPSPAEAATILNPAAVASAAAAVA